MTTGVPDFTARLEKAVGTGALVLLSVLAAPPMAFGLGRPGPPSSEDAKAEVRRAEAARIDAILRNDAAALERLLADALVTTLDAGDVKSKAEELDANRAGARNVESWEASDVAIRVYGDAAVVTGRTAVEDSFRGEGRRRFTFRFTHVWARLGGRWQLVARHISGRNPPRSQAGARGDDAATARRRREPRD